jgi:hypothetical protein
VVDLAEVAIRGPAGVRAARMLVADLMSAFGLPEPDQISEDGTLVLTAFHPDRAGQVQAWAQRNGVPAL